ncbi:diguanylate cyclase [Longimicrobium sp.]|uniref:diguanylate cyclase n=1 Tax=Longimicrobium sp. TaxID=2029185 RepID=UPI002E3027CF|nr:diguanylate cyclase [Longimicrobium sp.]HEX6040697.1 diguanylate cyclase [Longimicrobium sp.]
MQTVTPLAVPALALLELSPETTMEMCTRALALRHRAPAEAVDLARRAFALAETPDARRRARAALGACLAAAGDPAPLARELLQSVLRECEAANDDEDTRCLVLNELSACLLAAFEHDAALDHARRAEEVARGAGLRAEEARALRMMGTVHTSTGDFVQALPVLLRALALHEGLSPEGADDDERWWERGSLFGGIAIVYSNLDQYARALAYYEVALESFGERFPLRAARTLYRMGIAAQGLGDWAYAERVYRRSMEMNEAQGDTAGRALGLMGLVTVWLERQAWTDAEAAAAEVLSELGGDPAHAAYAGDAHRLMGEALLGQARFTEALAALEQALPLYHRTGRPAQHRAWLHERFCRAYRGLGAYDLALEHHERFHALMLEHLQTQSGARMAQMMVQFDTERAMKDREISRLRNVELEREIAERREAEAALARAKAALEESNRELRAISIRDPLTGVFNRRYLDERLAEAFALTTRQSQPLSVMICDVDDFKRINDTFSHAVGDEVLRTIAGILRANVRQSDVVARFGGEEFVVLFPCATREQAVAASEKLCRRVMEHPWHTVHPLLSVTLSAGVAAADGQPNHEKLLSDADRKLYQAKARGKNRVEV